MKILHLIQKPQLRGAEVFAASLATAMARKGHESVVVSIFPGTGELPFRGTFIRLNRSQRLRWFDWKGWRAISAIVAREKPDIVQANAGDTLRYAVMSRLLFGWKAPIVFRNASTTSLYLRNSLLKAFTGFLLRRVDGVISVSEHSRQDLIRLFPFVASKCDVGPVGIEPVAPALPTIARDGEPVFLHVGGMTFEKNHRGLVRIFSKLSEQFPRSVLWLVGDGPLRAETQALVSDAGLSEQVRFFGNQRDPASYMASADMLLFPSVIEGLPSVILEAFYHRLPVVAYDVGGIPELVRPGETGWLVAKDDESRFRTAVVQVHRDEALRVQTVDKAHALVMSRYTMEAVTADFVRIYERLILRNQTQPEPVHDR